MSGSFIVVALVVVVAFGVLVFVHELGHFLAARVCRYLSCVICRSTGASRLR